MQRVPSVRRRLRRRTRPAGRRGHLAAVAVSEVRVHPPAHDPRQAAGRRRRAGRSRTSWPGASSTPMCSGTSPQSARAGPDRRRWPGWTTRTRRRAGRRSTSRPGSRGVTGYPIVDAGMRQLLAEGWMHNRVRMIVASFLVKDLHIWWRAGCPLVPGAASSTAISRPTTTAGSGSPAPEPMRRRTSGCSTRCCRARSSIRTASTCGATSRSCARLDRQGRALAVGSTRGSPEGYPAPIVDHAAERKETLARYESARRAQRSRDAEAKRTHVVSTLETNGSQGFAAPTMNQGKTASGPSPLEDLP